ncbi:MAG: hypothetical protein HY801_01200 [Candidatus Lindowbacteria bacterium]|nr:hypothetical protein [Candidatus Lindowbacteria bacterium]
MRKIELCMEKKADDSLAISISILPKNRIVIMDDYGSFLLMEHLKKEILSCSSR